MSIYLLWGEDDFRLEKALKKLRSKILGDEFSPLSHRLLKNPDPRILLENLQTTGMMFGSLLIEVHSKTLFLRTKEKDSFKDFTDQIIDTLENLFPTVNVIFICNIEKGSKKKIDGATKIVKTIKKIGEIQEFQPFRSYKTNDILNWIQANAKEKGIIIKPDAANELLLSLGENIRQIDSETDKLELLAYPEKTVTKKMVESLGLSCNNIFAFTEALLSENKSKAYVELEKLLEKDDPLRIIAFLQSNIKKWISIKIDSQELSNFEISKKINLPEFIIQKELEKLSKTTLKDLIAMQKRATETEFKIKTGKLEPKLALETML